MLMDSPNMFCVIGPPGCGKTYSISQSVQRNVDTYGPRKVLVCSLTNTAAVEAAGRVNLPRQQVGTLHSFAYRSLSTPGVVDSQIDDWNKSYPAYAIQPQTSTDDVTCSMDVRSIGDGGEKLYAEYSLLRAKMTNKDFWPTAVKAFAKRWEDWKASTGLIDFNDMIEMCLTETLYAPGNPDVIYMDEAQDSSRLEAALLKRWGAETQKTVVVGDPNQSLFVWRGAAPEDFFPDQMTGNRKHVLQQSFRVPRKVLNRSVQWISRMPGYCHETYRPRKDEDGAEVEGVVKYLDATLQNPRLIIDLAEKKIEAEGKTVMVLASCGYMLNTLISELRAQGIPFHNPYRRRAGNWNPLGGKGVTSSQRLLSLTASRMDVWGDDARIWTAKDIQNFASIMESKGILKKGAKAAIAAYQQDDTDILDLIDEWFLPEVIPTAMAGDVDWWYANLLKSRRKPMEFPVRIFKKNPKVLKEEPKFLIGTVHSVKGGQADVVIVSPELSAAAMKEWNGKDKKSIYRLFYVAMTRAREELYLLSPGGGRCLHVDW